MADLELRLAVLSLIKGVIGITSGFAGLTVSDFDLGNGSGLGIIRALQGLISSSIDADVAELVDALDLGSSIARCGSSSLPIRTIHKKASLCGAFCIWGLSAGGEPPIGLELLP